MELGQCLAEERNRIEIALEVALPKPDSNAPAFKQSHVPFAEAVRHAIKAGGKRVRPTLTLLAARACGVTQEQEVDALRAAVAIEFLHSYTLVHDDLPCMDNDTERRGAPTVWAKYGESNAVLVGDMLQALAFGQLAPCRRSKEMLEVLSNAAIGVIHGQVADIAAAKDDSKTWNPALLGYVYIHKTAMLIAAACELGAIAADASDTMRKTLAAYGTNVGLAFQYVDDLLDAQQSQTGNELNALAVWDNDANVVRSAAEYATRKALEALENIPGDTAPLAAFAASLLSRLV